MRICTKLLKTHRATVVLFQLLVASAYNWTFHKVLNYGLDVKTSFCGSCRLNLSYKVSSQFIHVPPQMSSHVSAFFLLKCKLLSTPDQVSYVDLISLIKTFAEFLFREMIVAVIFIAFKNVVYFDKFSIIINILQVRIGVKSLANYAGWSYE